MRPFASPRLTALVLGAVLVVPAASHAQSQVNAAPPAAAKSVVVATLLKDIAQVEQKLTGLAEAIPEASWGWRPSEGVRSVSDVIVHVAADNYFIPTIAEVTAPAASGIKAGDYPSVQAYEARKVSRAEAIQALKESFAHLRTAMEPLDDAALAKSYGVFGRQMSGLDLWVLATTHLHEHLGQLIAYGRANNVTPPWSRGN